MSEDSDYFPDLSSVTEKPRKRKLQPDKWKKNQERKIKRTAKDKGYTVVCSHTSDKSYCKVDQLTEDEIQQFHDKYWSVDNSVGQTKFLQRHIVVQSVSRRKSGSNGSRKRMWSTKYSVQGKEKPIQVCKESFMSILSIKRAKVEKASKDIIKPDEAIKETRGGVRVNVQKEALNEEIIAHIKMFKCREKHYGRNNTPGRSYLSHHLSVKKMWQLFCGEDEKNACIVHITGCL